MKKIFKFGFVLAILLAAIGNAALAEGEDVNVTIRSGEAVIFDGAVPLPAAGTVELNGHALDADSVLNVLNNTDTLSPDFEITDIQYYDSFGSFYLKCINSDCDNWQYTVDGAYPGVGMDQNILSGGESVYVYFGPQNRVTLSNSNISTNDTLSVTAEEYDYENNGWLPRNGVTVGLTQPNPDSPIEIATAAVDGNGQATFSGISTGSYDVGIKEDFYFPTETLTVTEAVAQSSSGGGGGSSRKKSEGEVLGAETISKWDTDKAFDFLWAQQQDNSSFGADIYTDWTALALASGNSKGEIIKLIKYFGESKMTDPLLTDYERRAMALMALGLNPYSWNGENYIGKIAESFDGAQFGDVDQDNDDIFALIVLANAGYGPEEEIIKKSVTFVLGRQKENGSWDESIDMTGAAIVALAPQMATEPVKNALEKAKNFLAEAQKDRLDGSWVDNVSSTAWALQGLYALDEDLEDWERGGYSPLDFLASRQDTDGGIKSSSEEETENIDSRVWETAYAVSAMSGKTWSEVMQKFAKPELPAPSLVAEPKPAAQKTKLPELKKITPPQIELPPIENTASVISATESETEAPTKEPKRSWLMHLLANIFGF